MNIASLKLCKELYKLSGWGNGVDMNKLKWLDYYDDWSVPAYDSGYLLRKLPPFVDSKEYPGNPAYLDCGLRDNGPPWFCWYAVLGIQDVVSDFGEHADTPEDALVKLAINLFKQGVLTKEGVNRE